MREKWEEAFNTIAFMIAGLITGNTCPTHSQQEVTKSWLKEKGVAEMLKDLVGKEK